MAKKKNETLDEIVAKLDAAEKEYQEKWNQINLDELLKKSSDADQKKDS